MIVTVTRNSLEIKVAFGDGETVTKKCKSRFQADLTYMQVLKLCNSFGFELHELKDIGKKN